MFENSESASWKVQEFMITKYVPWYLFHHKSLISIWSKSGQYKKWNTSRTISEWEGQVQAKWRECILIVITKPPKRDIKRKIPINRKYCGELYDQLMIDKSLIEYYYN